ncbi:MAG: DUF4286 family protein [Paramuribaculum sp.]|nr:DUF4286 family protein [Paramuribaculum sp.]
MIHLNTTFYVHISVRSVFLDWVRSTYIPEATASGIFTSPHLMLVEHSVEPDMLTYAVQLKAENALNARRWHDEGHGAVMRSDIMKKHPQKVLFFSSFMDILPL